MGEFSKRRRSHRLVSIVLSVAMVFSLIIMPASGVADPGLDPDIVDNGTNLVAFGDVDKPSNGLNGVVSIEVTGTGLATTATVSFAGSEYATYTVGTATLGSIDVLGGFVAAPNDIGLYTAVKLPAGYDIVLSTVGGLEIAAGTVMVTLDGGVREAAKPDFRVTQAPDPVEAGGTTTITAEFTAMPMSGNEGGIDGATFELPEGFTPSSDGAVAMVGSQEASVVVDAGARTVTVDKFFARGTDALTVTLASEVATTPGEYAVTGTYKNVGGSATPAVTAFGKITVVDLGISVTADPALVGNANYGYAKADGEDVVTFTVKTNVPKSGVEIVAGPATDTGSGSLVETSAVTDENGVATFFVRSDEPSFEGDSVKAGRAYKQFIFVDADEPEIAASGYAHFYTSEISAVSVSKYVAYADGVDSITYTFTAEDPVTKAPVPEGTRIYFAATGYDAEDTALSASSALTDANGQVSVDVSRDEPTSLEATGTNGLVKVAAQAYSDFSNPTQTQGSPAVSPGVQFLDYIASFEDTVTAQQSARGAAVEADLVIRDSSGAPVSFTRLERLVEATSTDVLKTAPLTAVVDDSTIHVAAEVMADDASAGRVRKAGDVVQAALAGSATIVGPLSDEKTISFGVDLPINIVNNASAMGMGSIYLGKANITGSNFKPGTPAVRAVQGDTVYTLTGTTIGVDLDGIARPQLFDLPVTMLEGTYDLLIDGITFPGALVVGDGIGIGVNKVVIQMGASRGIYPYYALPGTAVTLFGVVTTTGNASVPSAIVHVYSSSSADGSNPTLVGSVLTSNGQFGYRVLADKTRYYFATTNANTQYMAADSREMYGEALRVGVKKKASLKIISAPTTVRSRAGFTVKASIPRHSADATVLIRTYRYESGRWVYKKSFTTTVAAGQTSFYRTIKLYGRGKWRIRTQHSDYNHLTSYSSYRGITAR